MLARLASRIVPALCPILFIASASSSTSHFTSKPVIRPVATLHTARAAHTATTLLSGQVLLTGGMADGGGSLASAELFDPAGDTLQQLPPLSQRRAGHTATRLPDGRVLLAGGYNGEYLASIEMFDPSTRRFREVGSLMVGRSGHTATLLPDGRVLFIGGVGEGWTFLASAEVYDPETGRSESVGPMHVPREGHTATVLVDGRVLVVGGHAGRRQNMVVHASAEVFQPRANRFVQAGMLGMARHKHDAARLPDGRVLIIGGADRTDRTYYASTEIYDPGAATFEPGPSMAHRRYKITGTSMVLPGGNVLVTSGARVAEVFDVAGRTFREVAGALPDTYHFAASAVLTDGDVVITGGYSNSIRNTAGVWRFRHR